MDGTQKTREIGQHSQGSQGWEAETLEGKIKFLVSKRKVLGSMNKMMNILNSLYLE